MSQSWSTTSASPPSQPTMETTTAMPMPVRTAALLSRAESVMLRGLRPVATAIDPVSLWYVSLMVVMSGSRRQRTADVFELVIVTGFPALMTLAL